MKKIMNEKRRLIGVLALIALTAGMLAWQVQASNIEKEDARREFGEAYVEIDQVFTDYQYYYPGDPVLVTVIWTYVNTIIPGMPFDFDVTLGIARNNPPYYGGLQTAEVNCDNYIPGTYYTSHCLTIPWTAPSGIEGICGAKVTPEPPYQSHGTGTVQGNVFHIMEWE
jgi:hypothetical protein